MPAKKTIFQKIGDDAVHAKTDKVWKDWFKILDKFDVRIESTNHRANGPCEKGSPPQSLLVFWPYRGLFFTLQHSPSTPV